MFGEECGRGAWDPWGELGRLQDELNRLFTGVRSARGAGSFPRLNVWTNDEGAVLTADLPGVDPEGIEISVLAQSLTLRGKREPDDVPEGSTVHQSERYQGSFARTVELPFRVDADRVEASYDRGLLRVTVPRAQDERAKRVKVTG